MTGTGILSSVRDTAAALGRILLFGVGAITVLGTLSWGWSGFRERERMRRYDEIAPIAEDIADRSAQEAVVYSGFEDRIMTLETEKEHLENKVEELERKLAVVIDFLD